MIRQAHTYLVGAMGGATLIGVSIAVFVMLVSAQVFKDWPIASLGGGDETAEVSTAQPAGGSTAGATGSAKAAAAPASHPAGARSGDPAGSSPSVAGRDGLDASVAGPGTTSQPGAPPTGAGGDGGGSGATEPSSQAADPAGSAGSTGASKSSPSGGSGSSGGSGGNGGGGGSGTAASTPTGQVTETVNGTVAGADEKVLGGALQESGVTEATEGVVNGVVGPESVVGHVVDETVGAVGGLLPGHR